MVVLEVSEIEIDYCTSCRGTWLDAGELELLLDGAANRDDLLEKMSHSPVAETPIPCPICDHKMTKVECGDDPAVILDKCNYNHGLWFDNGELHRVLEIGEFPADHRVYSLFEEVFHEG